MLSLGSHRRARDLSPDLESVGHLLAVLGSRQEVASRTEVRDDRPVRGEKALRVPGGFEPRHALLPLARRER